MTIKKRLIICCDGTGQHSITGQTAQTKAPTNVFRLYDSLKDFDDFMPERDENCEPIPGTGQKIPQIKKYFAGVGADSDSMFSSVRLFNQAFGAGLDAKVKEAYEFLVDHYESEDDEIYMFGFSRGAFTVRAIASFICNAGLLKKEGLSNLDMIYERYQLRRDTKEKRDEFERYMTSNQDVFKLHKGVVIRVMGIWDTVGSLGIPETESGESGVAKYLNEGYKYHDTSLPTPLRNNEGRPTDWKAVIVNAYQALSLDERRASFRPTLLRLPLLRDDEKEFANDTGFLQAWFPGVHTDVGGGYERTYRDLSDISFAWMVDLARTRDLAFHEHVLDKYLKETTLNQKGRLEKLGITKFASKQPAPNVPWGLSEMHDELNTWAFSAAGARDRTPGQYYQGEKWDENGREYEMREFMHPSVRLRWLEKPTPERPRWRPKSLEGWTPHPPDPEDGTEYAYLWRWEKTVNGKKIVIPEDNGIGYLQLSMLTEKEKKLFDIPDETYE